MQKCSVCASPRYVTQRVQTRIARMEFRRSYSTLIFMLFVLWLNMRSMELAPAEDDDVGLVHGLEALNRTVLPTEYPVNISDWFKGTWKLASGRHDQVRKWPKNSGGSLSMVIQPTARPSGDVTLLKGEVELFDGEHVTERVSRTGAQGIYFSATGALLLVVNPLSESHSYDYTLVLPHNVSYTAAQLWNSQVDAVKFPKNPFSVGDEHLAVSNSSDVQVVRGHEKVVAFDSCTYILIAQVAKKEESKRKAPLRVWKYGKSSPFERSLDEDVNVGDLDENRMVYWLSGYMVSSRCGVMLEIGKETRSGDYDALVSSGQVYSVFAIIDVMCLLLLTIQHVETRKTNSAMLKIAPWTLLAQVSFDLIFSLFHLLLAFSMPPISRPIYFAFFLSFVLYTSFQVRYTLDVLQLVWPGNSAAGNLSRLYLFVYSYLGLSIFAILIFEPFSWMPLLLANSCWIPQILHNAQQRTRHPFDWKFIIGSSITRLFAPAYFYASKQTLIHMPHRPGLIAFLVLYNALQIALLICQDIFGPRFFVPAWLLPAAYNYHRPIPTNILQQALHDHVPQPPNAQPPEQDHLPHGATMHLHQAAVGDASADPLQLPFVIGPNCTICMSDVNPHNGEHMITPCNHIFHETCLLRWMDQKMECPVCRGRLPFPPELDADQNIAEVAARRVSFANRDEIV